MTDIDYTGSQILARAVGGLRRRNTVVAIARLADGRAQAQAHRTGLIDAIGRDHVFMSVEEAVRKRAQTGSQPNCCGGRPRVNGRSARRQ